jgi:hypothetical protein
MHCDSPAIASFSQRKRLNCVRLAVPERDNSALLCLNLNWHAEAQRLALEVPLPRLWRIIMLVVSNLFEWTDCLSAFNTCTLQTSAHLMACSAPL